MSAASATVRVIGPRCDRRSLCGIGTYGTTPVVGLMPKMPANDEGIRIEPPPSPPWARGPRPAATCADAPPLDPPGVRSRFQGLRVIPVSGLSVAPFHPNSGVVVLPRKTPPAPSRRRSSGVSSSGTLCSKILDPRIVRTPFVGCMSLMEYGMP